MAYAGIRILGVFVRVGAVVLAAGWAGQAFSAPQVPDNGSLPIYRLEAPYEALLCGYDDAMNAYGTYSLDNYVYLLFTDGTVYRNLTVPPEDFDADQSREESPDNWGVWEKDGDDYALKIPASAGDWKRVPASGAMAPARVGERLRRNLYLKAAFGNVYFGGGVSSRYWNFNPDGAFTKSASSMFNSGTGMNDATGTSAHASSYSDETGESAIAAGVGDGVFVSSEQSHKDGSDNRGRYRLAGHALELTYDSGRSERLLFGFCDGDRASPFLGDEVFWMTESDAEDALPVRWRRVVTENEQYYYTPPDVPAGSVYHVSLVGPQPLGSSRFPAWLAQQAERDSAMLGQVLQAGKVEATEDVHSLIQVYGAADGTTLFAFYSGIETEGKGRYVRIVTSDAALAERYNKDLSAAMKTLFTP